MPSGLKCKIKQLYKRGKITETEYNTLINKVNARSERIHKLLKENKPVEAKWKLILEEHDFGPMEMHMFCTNCWWHTDLPLAIAELRDLPHCPNCGAKITGVNEEMR